MTSPDSGLTCRNRPCCVNNCDNGEKKKNFAFIRLKDRNREEQIRELLKEYPSTDNSVTMLMDEEGRVLKRFYRHTDEEDKDKEQARKKAPTNALEDHQDEVTNP